MLTDSNVFKSYESSTITNTYPSFSYLLVNISKVSLVLFLNVSTSIVWLFSSKTFTLHSYSLKIEIVYSIFFVLIINSLLPFFKENNKLSLELYSLESYITLYSFENVIAMTKVLPCLYTFSIENISEKVSFYRSIGLGQIPIVKPVYLMQSVDLSYARYCFYKDKLK